MTYGMSPMSVLRWLSERREARERNGGVGPIDRYYTFTDGALIIVTAKEKSSALETLCREV